MAEKTARPWAPISLVFNKAWQAAFLITQKYE